MAADPQTSDAGLPQDFIDWCLDPLARTVGVDPAFGAVPLHLKHEDDFDWRLHFKIGGLTSTTPAMQLGLLTEISFVMLEKGRYNGTPLASGTSDLVWDVDNACYHMAVSLNAPALAAYLATLDATSVGFPTGGFDCATAEAAAAGTTTTTTTTGTTSTVTTAAGATTPSALTDYEFMAEFRWVQNGKNMRSQTFSIFLALDLITGAQNALAITPPPPPTDWRFLCAMSNGGMPFDGQLFGYVKAPQQLEVLGMEVALTEPDAAQGFRIQLTDNTGTPLAGGDQYYGDLPANTAFATLNFGQVLPMNQGDEIRATILNYAGNSASGLVVNLICRQYVTNSPAGPSGAPGITSAGVTMLAVGAAPTVSIVGQKLNLGLPASAPGEPGTPGTIIADVDVTMLAVGATPTASLAGTTLNLGIPAPAPGAPGQGVTAAQANLLAPGSQATASITNGTLFIGIPMAPFSSVQATTLAPTATATATILAGVLRLGIPAGATGSYLHYSPSAAQSVAYNANSTTVTSVTFTGVGKPALVLLAFRNGDDVTFNQTDVQWSVTRSDQNGANLLLSGETLAHSGNTYPVMDMAIDPQTSLQPVTYTLNVLAYSGGLPGNGTSARASGHAGGPLLVVIEIVN